jgi:hypothetical protein
VSGFSLDVGVPQRRGRDYDYRGAFKAGITENISPHDNRPHWPSSTPQGRMLKSPQHPTTWKEFFMRHHGKDPDDMGLNSYEKALEWALKNGVMPK